MNRAGTYVNNLSGDAAYQSFRPSNLPPDGGIATDEETVALLISANKKLAELNTASKLIPDIDLFISMYIRKEALISSKIEGTQCTLEDVLNPENDISTNLDVGEVISYIAAVTFAIRRMEELPLCCRLLKETHAVLMNNTRGEEKNPGEFRCSQNWIGSAGCSLRTARYVPPNVSDMVEAMSALEQFINEFDGYDPLICAALIHYQFETVHPFLDGNGRLGRMLILLYFLDRHLLEKPIIYVSYFLKKNQIEYYDRISEVRKKGNYEQWVRFFLEAVENAAEDSLNSIYLLSALHQKSTRLISDSSRKAENYRLVLRYLEHHPIIDIRKTGEALDLSYNTVSSIVKHFTEIGILKESAGKSRSRVFIYHEYLDILREGTE